MDHVPRVNVAVGLPRKLIAAHAGREVLEVRPPDRLAQVEALVQGAGSPTRRTGTSIAILKADRSPNGDLPTDTAAPPIWRTCSCA